MRVLHAELAGIGIHELEPPVKRSGRGHGQRHARIIPRNGGGPHQQLVDRRAVAGLEEHRRAFARPFVLELLADEEGPFKRQIAALDQLKGGIGGHHLGDRGRNEAAIRLTREQDLPARHIDEQGNGYFRGDRYRRQCGGLRFTQRLDRNDGIGAQVSRQQSCAKGQDGSTGDNRQGTQNMSSRAWVADSPHCYNAAGAPCPIPSAVPILSGRSRPPAAPRSSRNSSSNYISGSPRNCA